MADTSSSTMHKNPLARAFGKALQRQRDRLGKSSGEIAKAVEIGAGYYRLIESGSNNLHVNKALYLVKAFDGTISLEAVTKILGYLSIMEMTARQVPEGFHYMDGIALAKNEISVFDTKFQLLSAKLEKILDLKDLKKKTPTEIEEILETHGFEQDVLEFLTRGEDYGKSSIQVQKEYLESFFNEVPTIYFEPLLVLKESLLRLPVRVGFQTLWQWESRNKDQFLSSIGYADKVESVVSTENLERYRYEYLWEPNFERVRFIFLTEEKASDIKKRYDKFLFEILNRDPIANQNKLATFEKSVAKVSFKSIDLESPHYQLVETLLKEPEMNKDNIPVVEFNAVWIFTMINENNIGFLAEIDYTSQRKGERYRLIEGVSLNPLQTLNKLKTLNALWKALG